MRRFIDEYWPKNLNKFYHICNNTIKILYCLLMKAQIDYEEYADENQQQQIQNQLYKNNLNLDEVNLAESLQYFSADNFGNLNSEALDEFLHHLSLRHPDENFRQSISEYFELKQKLYENSNNQDLESEQEDNINFSKSQLQKVNEEISEKQEQFFKLKKQNMMFGSEIETYEQIIRQKLSFFLQANQENCEQRELQEKKVQVEIQLQQQESKLNKFKEQHKMLGQNQIRHFDHEYKQINISFESINDRKKQLLRVKDYNKRHMQNYNTLKNQNFKRQQDIREREEIIRIEEIKKQNEELQNIRLSSIVEAENNKRKVKSVKKQKQKEVFITIQYQKPSRIINLLLLLWFILLAYFTINMFL